MQQSFDFDFEGLRLDFFDYDYEHAFDFASISAEREGDRTMTERALKNWMIERDLSILEGSTDHRIDAIRRVIEHCLPRKSVSDRTCHKRIVRWICGELEKESIYPETFLKRLIDAVIEATNPSVNNPNAVFITILKKEFGYVSR